ncbi:MAG: FIST N-terminal domain-containing protein [bacterium]
MINAGVGYSSRVDIRQAADEAAGMAVGRIAPRKVDWLLVFGAPRYFRDDLGRYLRNSSGTKNIIGCSARGIITTEAEHYGVNQIGVLAVSAPKLQFCPFYENDLQLKNYKIGKKLGALSENFIFNNAAICVFPDPFSFKAPLFFRGFSEQTGFYPLLGGSASNTKNKERITYQLSHDNHSYNALSGFVLSGAMKPVYGVSQAHYPIGESLLITKAKRNYLIEIEGEPAMQVMARTLRQHVEQVGGSPPRSLHIALSVNPESRLIKRGEYLVRDVLGVDTSKNVLVVDEQLKAGQKMSFALENSYGARENFRTTVKEMQKRAPGSTPAFGLLFKCGSRNPSFYNKKNVDLDIIKEGWGEFPLLGFESSSEIAPLKGNNYEHEYSAVLLLVFPQKNIE